MAQGRWGESQGGQVVGWAGRQPVTGGVQVLIGPRGHRDEENVGSIGRKTGTSDQE